MVHRVGTLDDFRNSFGETALDRPADRQPNHVWGELCCCGHLSRYHDPLIGGTFPIAAVREKSIGGRMVTITTLMGGCVGALRARGFQEMTTEQIDRTAATMVERINVTCPCAEFRPVAQVDRPNRFFNQRMPTDLSDPIRHPFSVGIRAFRTHLSKRRAALSDPSWAEREFDRRFLWIDGARVCGVSRCKDEGTGVWPQFIRPDGTTELRCAKHR
jgi:hypothetical protein